MEMRIQRRRDMSSPSSSSVRATPPTSNISRTASAVEDRSAYDSDSNGSSIGSLEEEWDLGSEEKIPIPYTAPAANRHSGELILSGDEDSSYGGNVHDGKTRNHMFLTAVDLSLPGTDSLPTDLDSLDVVSYIPSSAAGTSLRSRPLSTGTLGDSDVDSPRDARRRGRALRSSSLLVPFLLATTFATTTLSAYLAWDRNAWRAAALRLEDDLQRLQSDAKTNYPKCKREKSEVRGCSSNSSDFDWANECHPQEKKIVLADNCWLHAEAALSFGDCAENVRSAVKKFFDHVGSEMANAMSVEPTEESPGIEELEHFGLSDVRPQTAGFTLQNIMQATSSIASTTTLVGDAIVAAVSEASGFFDDYVSTVVSATRDAIEENSLQSHIDH